MPLIKTSATLITILLSWVVILSSLTPSAFAQANSLKATRYERILSALMPLEQTRDASHLAITLRFRPSSSPECHIQVRITDLGEEIRLSRFSVPLKVVTDGASSDEEALRRAKEMLKQQVSRSSQSNLGENMWSKLLWVALAQSPPLIAEKLGSIQLDGTLYEFRLETNLQSLSWTVRDECTRACPWISFPSSAVTSPLRCDAQKTERRWQQPKP